VILKATVHEDGNTSLETVFHIKSRLTDLYNDNEPMIEVTTRQAIKSGPIIGHSGHCSGEVGKKSISWCPLYPGISGQVHPDHHGLVK
jgi:hypothetical protein